MTHIRRAAAVTLLWLAGCAPVAPESPAPATVQPPAVASPSSGPTEAEIEDAARFRREFGLPSDRAWIEQVRIGRWPGAVRDPAPAR